MVPPDQDQLLAIAREFYGRIAYTHKTHEKNRETWTRRAFGTKIISVLLAGLTTSFAVVATSYCNQHRALIATGVLAGVTPGFLIFQLSFDPAGKSDEHRRAAKDLLILRDKLLLLIETIASASLTVDQARNRLEALSAEVLLVYRYSPDTAPKAYQAASKGLKRDDELSFSNEEIDRLLPEGLRISELRKPREEK